MESKRVSVRIGPVLEEHLRRRVKLTGKDESTLVREALEGYLSRPPEDASAYNLANAAGLIGCIRDAPSDLSTNREHFEGFGASSS